jgi:hypothetical protein
LLTCRVPRFAVLLVLAAVVLGGCTPSTSASSPTPAVSVTTASPTPTLSEGQKAASDTVVKYRALIDELRSQGMPDISRLATLARDDAYVKWGRILQNDFQTGYHQVGVTALVITSTDPGAGASQWLVTGCLDMSKADMIDKNGKSGLATPAGKQQVKYAVDQDPKSLSWYVTKDDAGASC